MLTWVVDLIRVDGKRSVKVRDTEISTGSSSAYTLSSQLAVMAHDNYACKAGFNHGVDENGDYYLRSVTVHAKALLKRAVEKEAATHRSLIIEDAIASQPECLQAALSLQNSSKHRLVGWALSYDNSTYNSSYS